MIPIAQALERDDILVMGTTGKRGRQPSIPLETRLEMGKRVELFRKEAKLSYGEICEELSKFVDRKITPDAYRNWEESVPLPQDLIIPFCYITGADPWRLLDGKPFRTTNVVPFPTGKRQAN